MKISMRSALVVAFCVALIPDAEAQTCTPGITFGSLIGSVRVGFGDGRLQVDKLYAACLPQPARQSRTNFGYEPDDGGQLAMRVKSADGQLLNTYVWYAERIGTIWEMSRYKIVGGYESVKPLTAGDYVLEFAADDRQFQKFAFSVVAMKSDDPYQAAGNRYFIDGAWSEYGNLYFQRNDPQSSLTFTTWVQDRAGRESKRSVPYEIKLVRARTGQVVAEETGSLRLEPRWLTATLYFRPPGDKSSHFKAGEVLSEDGAYRIRLAIEGKPYGDYPFTIKGGRIELQGRQVREGTDPQDYITDHISGGRYTSWWLRRDLKAR